MVARTSWPSSQFADAPTSAAQQGAAADTAPPGPIRAWYPRASKQWARRPGQRRATQLNVEDLIAFGTDSGITSVALDNAILKEVSSVRIVVLLSITLFVSGCSLVGKAKTAVTHVLMTCPGEGQQYKLDPQYEGHFVPVDLSSYEEQL